MRFCTPYDDLLDEGPGRALGRILVSFQALEAAVEGCLSIMAAPSDQWDLLKMLTRKYTAGRRIELGQAILTHVSKLYDVPPVKPDGRGTYMFGHRSVEDTNQDVAQAFSALESWLRKAEGLLEDRNKLFHGELSVEDNKVRFSARGGPLPSSPEEIEAKRQQVLHTIMGLYLCANSFRAAVEYLMAMKAKGSPPGPGSSR